MSREQSVVPTNDYFARYLFANPGNEGILLHFLNALRKNANETPFTDIELLDTFNLKENTLERQTIVDVKARTATGELVLIEVQNFTNSSFIPRILYYIAVNYAKQVNIELNSLEEGISSKIDYSKLKPIISVSLLNENLNIGTKKAHSVYRMSDIKTGKELSRDWEVHLLELQKDTKDVDKELQLWIKFFTSKNVEDDRMTIVELESYFDKVYEQYKKFSGDVELMEKYRDVQAYRMYQQDLLDIERKEARIQGLQQGIKEGIEKGIEQGIEKRNREIVENLCAMGLKMEDIAKATGLSKDEIERFNHS